jgi:hypothetical protein
MGGQFVPVLLEVTHRLAIGINFDPVSDVIVDGAGRAIDHPSTVSSEAGQRHRGPP